MVVGQGRLQMYKNKINNIKKLLKQITHFGWSQPDKGEQVCNHQPSKINTLCTRNLYMVNLNGLKHLSFVELGTELYNPIFSEFMDYFLRRYLGGLNHFEPRVQ